ncbi:group XV phospholipase [Chlorella sorokiniana]|uniref:Group XV phospholipase n=1 Tax=Chlorella sorokiniana TaxID=3076 RepID=A0A2P6TNQ8_CHLSO|nr:group XV phospholipase [Chlorella sorokiniana]|eukprot:PRW50953.1 group XV phospholipase [Chlorella sorokiniana]
MECTHGGDCRSPAGIEVRPKPGFESGMGVAPGIPGGFGKTFGPLADALEQLGWSRGGDMRAHLYDWRRPPADWVRPGGSFDQLQNEIEAAVADFGRPVAAISLSLGSLYFGLFARRHVSVDWAEHHLAGHISLSGTWAGSLWAPLAIVAGGQDPESQGLNPLVPALQQDSLRSLLRSTPVLPYLAPAPAVFGDQPLVQDATSGQQYSAAQMAGWLRDSSAQQAADVWEASEAWMERGGAPPVESWCLFGTGVNTVTSIEVLPPGKAEQRYRLRYGDGDGTVPLPSLQVCDGWHAGAAGTAGTADSSSSTSSSRQPATHVRRYPGLGHGDIIHSAAAFADVLDALMKLGGAGRAHSQAF